jgi:hypothetical protein
VTRVLPRPFDALDDAASSARNCGRALVAGALCGSVAAAGFEAIPWESGDRDISAFCSAGALLVAFILSALLAATRPDQRWHRLRAAVEAADGLQWEWASQAGVFADPGLEQGDRDQLLEDRLAPLLDGTGHLRKDIDISPSAGLREQNDHKRFERYRTDRLEPQIEYYRRRARECRWLGRLWIGVSLLAQLGGVAVAVLKGLGELDVDLLGVAATVATAAAAWTRARDHTNLATIYGVTRKLLRAESECLDATSNQRSVIARVERSLEAEHSRWLERRGQLGLTVG